MLSVGFSVSQVTLFVLVSGSIGAMLGLWLSPSARQARQLTIKLEQTRAELEQYQNNVTQHFVQTAQHFRELTTQYHELFEHLRSGANQLCRDEQIQRQLAALRMPSKSLLDAEIHDVISPTTKVNQATGQPMAEAEPA